MIAIIDAIPFTRPTYHNRFFYPMTLSQDRFSSEPMAIRSGEISLPLTDCPIECDVPLQRLTTWKVGGLAQWYLAPHTLSDLQTALIWAKQQDLPLTIIGAGSNLLISDRGLPGLVICTRHLRYTKTLFDQATNQITADGGKMIASLAWQAARRGWTGLEWAAGIPGTVGGAVVMNAGAHGHSTQEVLISTEVLSLDGSIATLTPADLDYRYRHSNLQGDSRIVISATFQLQPTNDPKEIQARTFRDLEKRHTTQPYDLPSCGSVFRNPSPLHAAYLIEGLGLKGYRIGDAEVSTLHANFIINRGHATASEIRELIYYVREQVKQHHGISLEPEVKMLGEF
jgi:UDP-N-acetylmuramate dehydrogenase